MRDSRPELDIWRFGLFERMLLMMLLLMIGSWQIVILEAVLLEHGALMTEAAKNVTDTWATVLLVSVVLLAFGGPVLRAGAAKIGPRVRSALGV